MSKSFFQFKQFKVHHDRCAMKVGTDGVLLGAWTNIEKTTSRVLDVGAGSGLIALMLAQRSNDSLHIDAIDIDEGAVQQSLYNVEISPFFNINVYHQSLTQFAKQADTKYDLIISNPPYFVSSLISPDKQRTLARHTQSLSIEGLLIDSKQLLSDFGCISIIYPYDHKNLVLKLAAENNLYVKRVTNVYPTPTSQPKRILVELTKTPCLMIEEDVIIEVSRHVYSLCFLSLVKDFYLKL